MIREIDMCNLKRLFLFVFFAPFWIPLFILFLLIIPEEEFINDDLLFDRCIE